MQSVKKETDIKTPVPFIYKGYRLYPLCEGDNEKYLRFTEKAAGMEVTDEVNVTVLNSHTDYLFKKYNGKENKGFLIYKEGELVGSLFIANLRDNGIACITTINLLKEHQGKGIGRGMMTIAETLAKDSRCHSVELFVERENNSVIDFYKKIGYTIKTNVEDGWYMEKRIIPSLVRGR